MLSAKCSKERYDEHAEESELIIIIYIVSSEHRNKLDYLILSVLWVTYLVFGSLEVCSEPSEQRESSHSSPQ